MSDSFRWLKGHGTENDFIVLPDPDGSVHGPLDPDVVARLCHRRRGIGADGVLRLIRTDALRSFYADLPQTGAEWFMDYRNSDGSLSEMCGNGIRVLALHLLNEGLSRPDEPLLVGTRAGTKVATYSDDGISVEMGQAEVLGTVDVGVGERRWQGLKVSTGNPHAVVFVDDLAEAGPLREPPRVDAGAFPDGVNVEFVRRVGPGQLAMRVHERGSGETRSCGTGACAAAVADAVQAGASRPVHHRVDVPGGTLRVLWDQDERVHLAGPASIVARGESSVAALLAS